MCKQKRIMELMNRKIPWIVSSPIPSFYTRGDRDLREEEAHKVCIQVV